MSISNYDFNQLKVGDTVYEKGTRTAVKIKEIYNKNGTRGIVPVPGEHVIAWLPQANIAAISGGRRRKSRKSRKGKKARKTRRRH